MIDAVDQIMDVMASSFEPHWGEAWTRRQISDSMILPSSFHRLIDAKGNRPAMDRLQLDFPFPGTSLGKKNCC